VSIYHRFCAETATVTMKIDIKWSQEILRIVIYFNNSNVSYSAVYNESLLFYYKHFFNTVNLTFHTLRFRPVNATTLHIIRNFLKSDRTEFILNRTVILLLLPNKQM
jgi:hypothetical protein